MGRLKSLLMAFALGTATLALPACDTISAAYHAVTTPVDLSTVRKTAIAVNESYAVALDLANVYAMFPLCGTSDAVICADRAVILKIFDLDEIAYPLVEAMNKTVNAPGVDASIASAAVEAATNAISALKGAIPAPGVR